jgi:hypothetical protein
MRKSSGGTPKNSSVRSLLRETYVSGIPRFALVNRLLSLLTLIGMLLTLWEFNIYRRTFIPLLVPLSVYFAGGLLMLIPFRRVLNRFIFYAPSPGRLPLLYHLLYHVVTWGGIFLFLFMFSNQEWTAPATRSVELQVISSGHLAKGKSDCAQPIYG